MKKQLPAIFLSIAAILAVIFAYQLYSSKALKVSGSGTTNSLVDVAKSGSMESEEIEEKIVSIRISAVGDIMVHDAELNSARSGDSKIGYTYDFKPFFTEVKPIIESADLAIGNLETTISGEDKKYTGYPMFNSPDSLLDALKWAGFDLLSTSNNHCLDRREYGLAATIDNLDKRGLLHTGTFKEEKDRDNILIVDVKGIKIAVLAYTYGTNGIPIKNPYQVNLLDIDTMLADVGRAREKEPDIIIACLHFGDEYVRQPNDFQKEITEKMLHAGVDIVLGSHPHVVQPAEMVSPTSDDANRKDKFVIYSMGNFISDQRGNYKDIGVITNLYIEKNFNTKEVSIYNYEFIPTWVQKYTSNKKKAYRILSMPTAIKNYEDKKDKLITSDNYLYMKKMNEELLAHLKSMPPT